MCRTILGWSDNRLRALFFVGLALFVAIVLVRYRQHEVDAKLTLVQARAALKKNDYLTAESQALKVRSGHSEWTSSRLIAGEAAMKAGRYDDAIDYFDSIPRDRSRNSSLAAFSVAEIQRELGRLTQAEENYLYALSDRPSDPAIHERLAFLMGVTGRRWESQAYYHFLLRSGQATLEELVLMGDQERPIQHLDYLEKCLKNSPDDPLVQLGHARSEIDEGNVTSAQDLLKKIIKSSPELIAAQVMLGELLVNRDESTFLNWHSALPAAADDFPDTWLIRGMWARRQGDLRVAVRCFWETLNRSPTHRRATNQLGQVLIALGEKSGPEFAERSEKLFRLTQDFDLVMRSQGRNESAMRRVTESMDQTGRIWEACAWASISGRMSGSSWARTIWDRLNPQRNEKTPNVLDSLNLARKYNFSKFPDHRQLLTPTRQVTPENHNLQRRGKIRFEEESNVGLDFVYFNGSDPLIEETSAESEKQSAATKNSKQTRRQLRPRMFEQTGGGVAVLDYDLDGSPDIYFPQGTEWKHGTAAPTLKNNLTDRLFRNLNGKSFVEVSHQAGILDRGFGQGCTSGDFDNDGFPDLYVANIGRNQLYLNHGDGTFSEVTLPSSGLDELEWTASCVIVDLNADGHPDLFDVNYLSGPRVYDLVCNGHACSPKGFQSLPDRLWISRGDGTFENIPNSTPAVDSKGLGIIAAEFQVRRRPCLFIANDQVPNFFLKNSPASEWFNIHLENEAFARGLAFNDDGMAMASMGIAADDINHDGRIDFLVTTFKDESSTLYVQDAYGNFIDGTKASGLHAPSLPYVGWGTQFLDADRDGEPDVVVTNGHVDDYRADGGEYHMRPQFFLNAGSGRFKELFATEIGSVFEQKRLGRGLARLDWNRDGRMDFVVSNIGDSASLVTNHSTDVGRFVNIRLHATNTARDAIGSIVKVVANNREWSKQLLAGDGYMACNERILQFGFGQSDPIASIIVLWPSGKSSTVINVPADVMIEFVEESPRVFVQSLADKKSIIMEAFLEP